MSIAVLHCLSNIHFMFISVSISQWIIRLPLYSSTKASEPNGQMKVNILIDIGNIEFNLDNFY